MRKIIFFIAVLATVSMAYVLWQSFPKTPPEWTQDEVVELQSLSLSALPPLPADPGNAVADNPDAAAFGRKLFFDRRLSRNGGISCATCHQEERRFTDGLQKGQAIGTTDRHTPSIVGAAYSPWQFWDGRRDSLWSQALAPLEDAKEHATDRRQIISVIADDDEYRELYRALFGDLPLSEDEAVTRAFANVGKSIAAFERTLMPTPSRFDEYVQAVVDKDTARQRALFTDDEIWGLQLFIGEANCTQCHNGPLFTNHEFHNTGVISFPGDVPDKARIAGVREVMQDEFNCRGDYNDVRDAVERSCDELEFARTGIELIGAFKTPSLRNLEDTAPFMHKGQLASLGEVLNHYNEAPDAMIGHNEAKPLGLSDHELLQIELFLNTLAAPFTGLQDGGSELSPIIETTSSL